MKNPVIVFIFIFFNLYYPISPYLCMGVDLLFAIFFGNWRIIRRYSNYIFISAFLLSGALVSVGLSFEPEEQVLMKYLRTFISTVVLVIAASGLKISANSFLRILSFVFLLHIIAIVIQMIFPPASWIMAPLFNFDRDIDIIQSMQLRKMGLSGGFDAAAMLLISGILLYFYQFFYKQKILYFVFSVLGMAMTLFVSRTGMLMAAGCMVYFAIISIRSKKMVRKMGILMTVLFGIVVVNLILPFLIETNGLIFDMEIHSDADVSFFTQDYSAGNSSAEHLMGDHLFIIEKLNPLQFLLGAGNSSKSDIGYVQMLFQIGLLGVFLIIILHVSMFKGLWKFKPEDSSQSALKSFCLAYIVVLFLFNYKVLLLYSRGFYDFLLICCVYINNIKCVNRIKTYEY